MMIGKKSNSSFFIATTLPSGLNRAAGQELPTIAELKRAIIKQRPGIFRAKEKKSKYRFNLEAAGGCGEVAVFLGTAPGAKVTHGWSLVSFQAQRLAALLCRAC